MAFSMLRHESILPRGKNATRSILAKNGAWAASQAQGKVRARLGAEVRSWRRRLGRGLKGGEGEQHSETPGLLFWFRLENYPHPNTAQTIDHKTTSGA